MGLTCLVVDKIYLSWSYCCGESRPGKVEVGERICNFNCNDEGVNVSRGAIQSHSRCVIAGNGGGKG